MEFPVSHLQEGRGSGPNTADFTVNPNKDKDQLIVKVVLRKTRLALLSWVQITLMIHQENQSMSTKIAFSAS
jgi:hypothetical protein